MDNSPPCAGKNLHVLSNHPSRRKLQMRVKKILTLVLILIAIVGFSGLFTVDIAQVSPQQNFPAPAAKFTKAVAFDVSAPLRSMPSVVTPSTLTSTLLQEIRPERGPDVKDQGYSRDGALQTTSGRQQ